METNERRGTIQDVRGNGGILMLEIKLEDGKIELVKAENASTVRALVAMLGPQIVHEHALLVDRIRGVEILFDTDDIGLLAYIAE
jgi:hypothetical protein